MAFGVWILGNYKKQSCRFQLLHSVAVRLFAPETRDAEGDDANLSERIPVSSSGCRSCPRLVPET